MRKPIVEKCLTDKAILDQAEKAISYCLRLKKSFDEWAIPKDFLPGDADYFAIKKLFLNKHLRKKVERRLIWYREILRRVGFTTENGRLEKIETGGTA